MRVTDLLQSVDLFENLPADSVAQLARLFQERRLSAGEVLFHQDEPNDAMFIVTGGSIRLAATETAGNECEIATFREGQFFGELALVGGGSRTGTAVAVTDSRVLVLRKRDFDELTSTPPLGPQIMLELLKVISQRTALKNQQLLSGTGVNEIPAGTGRVYAVFSPRGGSGKTTLAVNLAVALLDPLGDRVGLLDLNLTFGHAALLLNLADVTPLAELPPEVLSGLDRQTLNRYTTEHPSGLRCLIAALRPEEGEAISAEHVKATLTVMKRQFLVTVIDCGGSLTDPVLAALEIADRVILVSTPEMSSIQDTRECERVFGEVLRLPKAKMLHLLNHYQAFKVLTREQVEQGLAHGVEVELPHAGDTALRAVQQGEPLVTMQPKSAFSKAVQKLALDLLPEDIRAALAAPRKGKPAKVAARAGADPPAARSRGLVALFRRG